MDQCSQRLMRPKRPGLSIQGLVAARAAERREEEGMAVIVLGSWKISRAGRRLPCGGTDVLALW